MLDKFRWGDYGSVYADPTNGSLWLSHEWVKSPLPNPFRNIFGWSTWWGNVQDPCGQTFCDVTSGSLGDTSAGQGVAWGDYDGDGDEDLYLANDGQANKLLRNDGGCTFTDVTTGPLGDTGPGRGTAWGDYDNDGDLDLYLVNGSSTANKLFRNEGNGVFSDVTSGPEEDVGNGTAATWVDYDTDGYVDLYIVNDGSANKLLRNDGCGGFVDVTSAPLNDSGGGQAAAWADYDNDCDPDLYLVNSGSGPNGKNHMFRNEGGGTFVEVQSNPLKNTGDGQAAAWADYDNDGDLDLCLVNNQANKKLFRNDGGDFFVDVPNVPFTTAGRGIAWADYDNDGDLDLYFSNDGANQLLRNDGNDTFIDVTEIPLDDGGNGRGVVWGDFDIDGNLDLYVVNNGSANKLLRNLGVSNNHWFHVDVAGSEWFNRSAIDARVRIVVGGVSQIREVSGGAGFRSQNALTAAFGLGSATLVDTVEVRWPGCCGVVTLAQVPADTVLTIQGECSSTGTIAVIDASMTGWSEQSGFPSSMDLHFNFDTTAEAVAFQVRYRVANSQDPWSVVCCAQASSTCVFGPGYNYEAVDTYPACELKKFEWQARASNDGWSAWSAKKTFTAQCLEGP